MTARAQRESRAQLEERFELRNALGASFAPSYVQSFGDAQRRIAVDQLAGPTVPIAAFRRAVDELDFDVAVLLDTERRILHVWPPDPTLVGTRLDERDAHLRSALEGRFTVSNVARSLGRNGPIVAFLAFPSERGRRVFSGGFPVGATPLEAYLKTAMPFSGGELLLVDEEGVLMLDNRPAGSEADAGTLESLDAGLREAAAAGTPLTSITGFMSALRRGRAGVLPGSSASWSRSWSATPGV